MPNVAPGSLCHFDACSACQASPACWLVDPTSNSDNAVAVVKNAEEQENLCCFELTKWMPCTLDLFVKDLIKGGWIRGTYRRSDHRGENSFVGLFNVMLIILKILFVAIALLFDILRSIFYQIPLSLFRCCCRVDPFNIPPTKSVVFNGYLYATAHFHDVDTANIVTDGNNFVAVDAGFEIAPGDANDVAVSNAHAWGTRFLSFSDSCHNSATKAVLENSITGNEPFIGVF